MPRWLEITLTLLLFAALMGVAGVVVNATVPDAQSWLVERVGHAGVWALLGAVTLVAALFAYQGHRKPKGTAGR